MVLQVLIPVAIPIVIPIVSIALIQTLNNKQNIKSLPLVIWSTWNSVHQWWIYGRPYFKEVHWGVKTKDNLNKLNNITNVSVIESWQEPFRSCYKIGLWVYPDNDSNYARIASITLQISGDTNLLTNKGWLLSGVSAFAVMYETIKSEGIVKPVAAALNSSTATCKYNISTSEKEYLEGLQSTWPVGHMIIHAFGERMLMPLLYTNWDNDWQSVNALLLSGAYFGQDFTGFKFIERDIKKVLNYVENNPECVYSIGNDVETENTIGDMPESRGLLNKDCY